MENNELIGIELDLAGASLETLELFVDESDDPDLFKEILDKNTTRVDVVRLLFDHPNTPEEVRAIAAGMLSLPVPTMETVTEQRKKAAEQKAQEIQKDRLIRRIAKMTVSEKVKLAMKGSGEARSILLKDSNKLVVMSVLENPRLTESEVLAIARSKSIFEEAIRAIASNREWVKSYSVQLALVTNSKTPPALGLKFVPYLKKKDLGLLEKNKNVSDAIRSLAKKMAKSTQH